MFYLSELDQTLHNAFRMMYEQYLESDTADIDADIILNDLDVDRLAQTIRQNMQTVYAYETNGNASTVLKYRGRELLPYRACLIYREPQITNFGPAKTEYASELWLMEDMTFCTLNSVTMSVRMGVTEQTSVYRVMDGFMFNDSWGGYDPEDIGDYLRDLCEKTNKDGTTLYEI